MKGQGLYLLLEVIEIGKTATERKAGQREEIRVETDRAGLLPERHHAQLLYHMLDWHIVLAIGIGHELMILSGLFENTGLGSQQLGTQPLDARGLIFTGKHIHHVRMIFHVIGDGDARIRHLADLLPAHIATHLIIVRLGIDEHSEGEAELLKHGKCSVVDRDVAVVKSDGNRFVRQFAALLQCLHQLGQRDDMKATLTQMFELLTKFGWRHAGGGGRGFGNMVIQGNGGVLRRLQR